MKQIPLTQGKFAIVDDEDFDILEKHKWSYRKMGNCEYAETRIRVNGKQQTIMMHRMILDFPKNKFVDHVDMNGLNNQRSNIRVCNRSQNGMNRKVFKNNKSGFKGVMKDKERGLWKSRIYFNKVAIFLGRFSDIVEAAKAYDAAAKRLFGDFARLNFP